MQRKKKVGYATAAIIVLLVLIGYLLFRDSSDALWKTVTEKCVPSQQQGSPAPCLAVNSHNQSALLKDRNGPHHDLLIPTEKITGIESPALQQHNIPAFFAAAWEARKHLSDEAGKTLPDDILVLAVNSRYSRTQEQLHIHISCLRPEAYQTLREQGSSLSTDWQPLGEELRGHRYLAKKLTSQDLTRDDPFKELYAYVQRQGDSIDNYGLALTVTPDGEKLLLANRGVRFGFNRGSTSELIDPQCSLAR